MPPRPTYCGVLEALARPVIGSTSMKLASAGVHQFSAMAGPMVSTITMGRLELNPRRSEPSRVYIRDTTGPGARPGCRTRARTSALVWMGTGAAYTVPWVAVGSLPSRV